MPKKPDPKITEIKRLANEILHTKLGERCLSDHLTYNSQDGKRLEKFQLALMQIQREGTLDRRYEGVFSRSLRTLDYIQKTLRGEEEQIGAVNAIGAEEFANGIDSFIIPKIKELSKKLNVTLVEYGKGAGH
jgi:hypothetical protein